jgi:hypothetical protein
MTAEVTETVIAEITAETIAATVTVSAEITVEASAVSAKKELLEKEARNNHVNAEKSKIPSRTARKTEG